MWAWQPARPRQCGGGRGPALPGSSTIDSDIRAKQSEIEEAQTALDEASKALADFNAVAPIDGTVTSCTLSEGPR